MNNELLSLLREDSFDIELLHENTSEGKKLYIEGIFAEAEIKNGNKRWYPQDVMETAVAQYNQDFVNKRRALGELNHPDYPLPKLDEAAIFIEKFDMVGSKVHGKALVMPTPKGLIVNGLIESGFNMGVSTRALGKTRTQNGIHYVNPGLIFTAIDCVDMPSGPNCYPNAIYESMGKWMMQNGLLVEVNQLQKEQKLSELSDAFADLVAEFVKTL